MDLDQTGRSRLTQKGIAQLLNVSQSTVARALDPEQQHKLLPQTVAHIQAEVKKLGYRPQRIASILRRGRSHTIGVIYRSGIYYSSQERARLLARGAIKAGYQIVAADLGWFGGDYDAIQDYLIGAAVEGVILCNVLQYVDKDAPVSVFQERGIPVVSMGSSLQGNWDRGDADMKEAYRQMTLHHLQGGSRRLMLLLGFHDEGYCGTSESPRQHRAQGFMEAVYESGGAVTADANTRQYLSLNLRNGGGNGIVGEVFSPVGTKLYPNAFEVGRVETERLILAKTLPDSLVCANDQIAAGALSACLQHGVGVPAAVKISGADNAPFSPYCGVPLTTISQPSERLAEWSVARVVELIENPEKRGEARSEVFPCEIIVRRSTASCGQQVCANS